MNPERSPRGLYLGLFLLTLSVLTLELLQMRLLSFMLWHHLAYMVISMVLLGLGAGGVFLSLRTRRILANAEAYLTLSTLAAALTTVLAFSVLSRIELDTFELSASKYARLAVYYAILLVPYFFAGLSLGIILTRGVAQIHRLYFVDLTGSAFGAGVFYWIIGPLGAPGALVLMAALLAAAGWIFSWNSSSGALRKASALVVLLLLAAVPFADRLIPARPAETKILTEMLRKKGARLAYSRWTPISRIDVVESEESTNPLTAIPGSGGNMKAINIDGDATTWMWRHSDVRLSLPPRPDVDQLVSYDEIQKTGARPAPGRSITNYHASFLLKQDPEVLIIGPGGGNEIFVALQMGASHVTGVELNPTMLEQSHDRYADFVGYLYQSPKAEAVVGEGRSYVRRSDRLYDIIQMSGVDTWSGLSSGAYVLSENYLYTVDAFVDFLGHLKPDGLLAVGRWRMEPPRECLRLVSLAGAALRKMGVERPQDQIVFLTLFNPAFATLLVKRSPFTPEEVQLLQKAAHNAGGTLYAAPGLDLPPNAYQDLTRAYAEHQEEAFFDGYRYDVAPVDDDHPFFFEYYKWSHLWHDLRDHGTGGQPGASWPIALTVLGSLLAQTALLSALLILGPLLVFRRRGLRVPHTLQLISYFFAVGLGFIFVEVAMMQRLVLFLGHPAYSIPVVLSSLLVSAGLGSLLGPYLPLSRRGRLGLASIGIAAILLLYLALLPPLFDHWLGASLGTRVVLSAALVGLPGLLMGIPFPLGLEVASTISEELVSWAWGINGAASVVGSILVIFLAMGLGFSWALTAAAGLYGLACLCLWPLANR